MSDYTILRAGEAPDYDKDTAGHDFLGYAGSLGSEQLGLNVCVLAPGRAHVAPGMDQSTGHSHEDIEEVYLVLEGEVTFKIDEDTFTLGPLDAVRIPPEARRGTRNDGDVEAKMVMVSQKMTDPRGQSHFYEGFWT